MISDIFIANFHRYRREIQMKHFCALFYWHISISYFAIVKQLNFENSRIIQSTDDPLITMTSIIYAFHLSLIHDSRFTLQVNCRI